MLKVCSSHVHLSSLRRQRPCLGGLMDIFRGVVRFSSGALIRGPGVLGFNSGTLQSESWTNPLFACISRPPPLYFTCFFCPPPPPPPFLLLLPHTPARRPPCFPCYPPCPLPPAPPASCLPSLPLLHPLTFCHSAGLRQAEAGGVALKLE